MSIYHDNEKEDIKELYRTPANKKLKYWAMLSIGISIALILAMIFWMNELSYNLLMFMRGCAGLFALIFVVLCTILVYRVNKEFINKR